MSLPVLSNVVLTFQEFSFETLLTFDVLTGRLWSALDRSREYRGDFDEPDPYLYFYVPMRVRQGSCNSETGQRYIPANIDQ